MKVSCGVGNGWRVSRAFSCWQLAAILEIVFVALPLSSSFAATADSTRSNVEQMIVSAAQAEIDGDLARSLELLREVVRIDPENQLARWQLGQIKVDNQWLPIGDAQRFASTDPLLAEYRERRSALGDRWEDQLTLAKWARRSGLTDESLYHWSKVLAAEPKNEEALRALNLTWQDGRLMSRDQIVDRKNQLRNAKRAAEKWQPKIAAWRRVVAGKDSTARDAALVEIRSVGESEAIPWFENVSFGRDARDRRHVDECLSVTNAFIDALAKMQGQPATESLARHAVFAVDESSRKSATEKLKPRDPYEYMPSLLSALGMPIESSYSVTTGPDGSVHYLRSLFREGPDNDWAWDSRHSAIQRDLSDHTAVLNLRNNTVQEGKSAAERVGSVIRKGRRTAVSERRYGNDAAKTESQITQANEAADTLNQRIVPVLAEVTGEKFGDSPKAWWDWWRTKNEYYTSDHPVAKYSTSGADYFDHTFDYTVPETNPHSCFGKGTLVWTKTGRKAIETIEPGDLVLSQDVNTGELKYKTVIRRTTRPPSPLFTVTTSGDELRVTGGHLLWVSGVGWRMAKELGDNAVLHCVTKSLVVRSVKCGPDGEAFNLIVADFNNYFVGENGVLAHDITARRPTPSVLPGVDKKLLAK